MSSWENQNPLVITIRSYPMGSPARSSGVILLTQEESSWMTSE